MKHNCTHALFFILSTITIACMLPAGSAAGEGLDNTQLRAGVFTINANLLEVYVRLLLAVQVVKGLMMHS